MQTFNWLSRTISNLTEHVIFPWNLQYAYLTVEWMNLVTAIHKEIINQSIQFLQLIGSNDRLLIVLICSTSLTSSNHQVHAACSVIYDVLAHIATGKE